MSAANLLLENFILPLSDFLLGKTISKDLKFLMKSQWWTRDEIDEYQNHNLRKIIKHSYENVPYYNELFNKLKLKPEDIKSKNDLYKIPITTKADIRNNFPDKITSRNVSKLKTILSTSSGSTGQPLQYYETSKTISLHKAAGIRAWYWMNYKLGDRYTKLSRRSRNSILKRAQDFVNNSNYLYFKELNEDIFLKMIDKIESAHPKIIRCYPVPLYYLAQVIETNGGINLESLSAINTTGSTLHPYMRKKIQDVFKCNIYDSYSCEGGANFSQCELLDNYHPSEEYAIPEFIDDDFSRNDKESAKRHITTDLFNYATPFIRYDTQDYIVLGEDKKCNCNRNYLNIRKIKGRDSDILVLPSGRYLLEYDFYEYFDNSSAVKQFQVYQEKRNLIRMRLIVDELFNDKIKKEICDYWEIFFGKDVEFTVEIVNKFELTPTGKRRILIRNPEIKLSL